MNKPITNNPERTSSLTLLEPAARLKGASVEDISKAFLLVKQVLSRAAITLGKANMVIYRSQDQFYDFIKQKNLKLEQFAKKMEKYAKTANDWMLIASIASIFAAGSGGAALVLQSTRRVAMLIIETITALIAAIFQFMAGLEEKKGAEIKAKMAGIEKDVEFYKIFLDELSSGNDYSNDRLVEIFEKIGQLDKRLNSIITATANALQTSTEKVLRAKKVS